MADTSSLSIGMNELPAFIHLCKKYGFADAHAVMNIRLIFRNLKVSTIGDFIDLFLDGNKTPKPLAMPVEFSEDCGDWSEFDEMMRSAEPMHCLGDPEEDGRNAYEVDEEINEELWERFMSDPDHPRYG